MGPATAVVSLGRLRFFKGRGRPATADGSLVNVQRGSGRGAARSTADSALTRPGSSSVVSAAVPAEGHGPSAFEKSCGAKARKKRSTPHHRGGSAAIVTAAIAALSHRVSWIATDNANVRIAVLIDDVRSDRRPLEVRCVSTRQGCGIASHRSPHSGR